MSLPERPLGSSGGEITCVGFGVWAIGGGGWVYSWGPQDDELSLATMRHALDLRHADKSAATILMMLWASTRSGVSTINRTNPRPPQGSVSIPISVVNELGFTALQEAFLKAYIQLSSYEGRGSLEGWLARITANQCSTKNKWQVRFAVLILFVVGFIAGGLTMNLYGRRQWSPRAGGRGGFEMMLDRLNLNEDQKTQVSAIFEDAEGNWPSCVKNPSRSSARCARVPMSG